MLETLIGIFLILWIILVGGLVTVGIAVSLFEVNPWLVFLGYLVCVGLLGWAAFGLRVPPANIDIN